jgi:hypothetical protein
MCINYFARRYGYWPLPFARPDEMYIDAVKTWLYQSNLEHFCDFLRPIFHQAP